MLRLEPSGTAYNKTGHRKALMERLNRRTHGSVEPKHQNIGAVPIETGLEMEARNRSPGDAGERFVVDFERARLIRAGKESLADKVEQVSAAVGPSAGFDILSFEKDGTDRFVEAKTTKYGKSTPFFAARNEPEFSRENSSRYFPCRVFEYRAAPRLFSLQGSPEDRCVLAPTRYLATPARIRTTFFA